jgi:membrane protein
MHAKPVTAVRRRYQGSLAREISHELSALDFVNQATLLGAGLLASLLPFLILLSAFANKRVDDDIALRLGLDHRAEAIVEQLFHSSPATVSVATLSSLLFVAAGTVAVASSLQQIYEKVFRQPRRGMRDLPRLLIWVAAVCGVVAFQSMVGRPVRNAWGGRGVIDLVTFAVYTPFFWWSMHFLLAGRVGWRRLLPSAVATGSLLTVLGIVSEFYFSSMIITDSRTFGDIGAVFALLTWLIAMGVAIILGALAGAVWHNRRQQPATPSQRQPAQDDAPAAFVDDSDQPNLPAARGRINAP